MIEDALVCHRDFHNSWCWLTHADICQQFRSSSPRIST